jgi:hypothetical protein
MKKKLYYDKFVVYTFIGVELPKADCDSLTINYSKFCNVPRVRDPVRLVIVFTPVDKRVVIPVYMLVRLVPAPVRLVMLASDALVVFKVV